MSYLCRLLVLLSLVVLASSYSARCTTFCEKAMALCGGSGKGGGGDKGGGKEKGSAFNSLKHCHEACKGFKIDEELPYKDIVGDNSLQCREFWIERMGKTQEETGIIRPGMCDYVAQGGGMCDPSVQHNCDAYCHSLTSKEGGKEHGPDCGAGQWEYPTTTNCHKACKQFKRDKKDSIRGNSLECRIYYLNIGEQSKVPDAKRKFCPNAGKHSQLCNNRKPPEPCADYCEFNSMFCPSSSSFSSSSSSSSKETNEQCRTYCDALSAEQLNCHMKYVAVAGRCTMPEVPCFHRKVCNAADGSRAERRGFEAAPIPGGQPQPEEEEDIHLEL